MLTAETTQSQLAQGPYLSYSIKGWRSVLTPCHICILMPFQVLSMLTRTSGFVVSPKAVQMSSIGVDVD